MNGALTQFFVNNPWAYHALGYANGIAHSHPLASLQRLWNRNPNQVMLNTMMGNPWAGLQTLGNPQVKPGSFI